MSAVNKRERNGKKSYSLSWEVSVAVCDAVLTHLLFILLLLFWVLTNNSITQVVFTKNLHGAVLWPLLWLPSTFITWYPWGSRCSLLSHRKEPRGSEGLGRWLAAETDSKPEKPDSRLPAQSLCWHHVGLVFGRHINELHEDQQVLTGPYPLDSFLIKLGGWYPFLLLPASTFEVVCRFLPNFPHAFLPASCFRPPNLITAISPPPAAGEVSMVSPSGERA